MKSFLRTLLGVTLTLASLPSLSMNLLDAFYDAATDELVFTIAYRGSHSDHTFEVSWEACRTMGDGQRQIFGIILDSDPKDPARMEFEKTERVSLKTFSCRPATVTMGLANPVYRRTLTIPAPPAQ